MPRGKSPKLFVFDLDDTIWRPEMYLLNGGAPFTKDKKTGRVRDRTGEEVTLYPAAREALHELATSKEWQGSLVCYASRCHETDWAHTCMDLLDVGDGLNVASCFNAGGVFQSGSKQGHFQVLASQHGVDFEDMIFFDNERWNITEVAKMGVTCVYTPNGLKKGQFEKGLQDHASRK
ncbi:magnesium-dependent phosphatase [Chloropicon roscoffensis]|uniref:Magnesium-dependent phosphatase n=1 Tax=Chloropicon roscoffensis TaxID=1461544 RepID=A0AAX4PLZ1_9CHLO